jgi:hypothetical protein
MRRKATPASFLLAAALLLLAACSPPQKTALQEQERVLRQVMLNWAILGQAPAGIDAAFPDGHMLSSYRTIVIQDDGSAVNHELQLADHQIAVLGEESVRARANAEGDYLFLRFEHVQVESDEATLRLSLTWALSKATRDTGRLPSNGGGAEVLFRRQDGVWVADRILSMWRSY